MLHRPCTTWSSPSAPCRPSSFHGSRTLASAAAEAGAQRTVEAVKCLAVFRAAWYDFVSPDFSCWALMASGCLSTPWKLCQNVIHDPLATFCIPCVRGPVRHRPAADCRCSSYAPARDLMLGHRRHMRCPPQGVVVDQRLWFRPRRKCGARDLRVDLMRADAPERGVRRATLGPSQATYALSILQSVPAEYCSSFPSTGSGPEQRPERPPVQRSRSPGLSNRPCRFEAMPCQAAFRGHHQTFVGCR